MKPTLNLRREVLVALAPDDLLAVRGGDNAPTNDGICTITRRSVCICDAD